MPFDAATGLAEEACAPHGLTHMRLAQSQLVTHCSICSSAMLLGQCAVPLPCERFARCPVVVVVGEEPGGVAVGYLLVSSHIKATLAGILDGGSSVIIAVTAMPGQDDCPCSIWLSNADSRSKSVLHAPQCASKQEANVRGVNPPANLLVYAEYRKLPLPAKLFAQLHTCTTKASQDKECHTPDAASIPRMHCARQLCCYQH